MHFEKGTPRARGGKWSMWWQVYEFDVAGVGAFGVGARGDKCRSMRRKMQKVCVANGEA